MNQFTPLIPEQIMAMVLAGGLSRRMGGEEKSLMDLAGRPPLQWVLGSLSDAVPHVIINANGDVNRFSFTTLPVVSDTIDGFVGPLAGVLAAMRYAASRGDISHILTAAADTPFLPDDLAEKLMGAINDPDDIAMARSGTRLHPVFGLWPITLADDLERFLLVEDKRKILEFAKRYTLREVDFPMAAIDPFFNINTPTDLAEARRYAAQLHINNSNQNEAS